MASSDAVGNDYYNTTPVLIFFDHNLSYEDYHYWNINTYNSSDVSGIILHSISSQLTRFEVELFVFLASVCIILTIIGNVLVVLSVFTHPPLKNVQNYYIVSLAGADMAVAVLVMPFNVAYTAAGEIRWQFGIVWCNVWLTLDILCCTASILHLCAIAIDRYYAIHDPINYAVQRTKGRVLAKILFVWLASAVISIPPLFGWNNSLSKSLYDEQSGRCQLTDERSFVVFSASGSFYIPLLIMTFVYVKIFLATRARLRARARALSRLRQLTTSAGCTNIVGTKSDNNINQRDDSFRVSDNTMMDFPTNYAPTSLDPLVESLQDTETNNCASVCAERRAHSLETPGYRHNVITSAGQSPTNEEQRSPSFTTTSFQIFSTSTSTDTAATTGQLKSIVETRQRISLTKERRAARTMAIIMGGFVVCWLPFFLMYVIFPFCTQCAEGTDMRLVLFIVWLGYVNSALNPIIYTVFNVDFRKAFINLLLCRCHSGRRFK